MNSHNIEILNWSSWLDFNKDTINNMPEDEGVYKMHVSMKILYIGKGYNLKQSLIKLLSNSCISNKPARFSYAITQSSEKINEFLLDEYRNKHNGKLPTCMES